MEFTVDFERNGFVGFHLQGAGLEIFHVGESGVDAEEDAAEIAHQGDVIHLLENADVEQSVFQIGFGEELKRAAIESAITDQDEAAFDAVGIPGDVETRRFFGNDLCGGEEIAQWSECFFGFPCRAFDDLRVEPDPGELDEAMVVGAGEIDHPGFPVADDFPGFDEIERDAEFQGEDVDGANREDAEVDVGTVDSVDDFVDRAVAASGNDCFVALFDGAFGLRFRVSCSFGELKDSVARYDRVKLADGLTRSLAPGCGVNDDAGFAHEEWRRREIGEGSREEIWQMRARYRWSFCPGGTKQVKMRVLRRIIIVLFYVVIALVLLIAAGWWALNSYVQSPAFAAQVKLEGSHLLGVPVEFKDVSWNLAQGINLNGLVLHNGGPSPAVGEFKVDHVVLRYDGASIWKGKLEITRLWISQPTVLIGQDAAGNFVLPVAPQAAAAPAVPPTASTSAPATATSAAPTATPSGSLVQISWKKFNVDKGTIEVKGNDGSTRLLCSGIDTYALSTEGDKPGLKGQLHIGEIWLLQKVRITNAHSPMSLEGDTFSLPTIEAEVYGGRATGAWEQNFGDPKKSYNLNLNLTDCDVNAVTSGVLDQTGVISGRLDAKTQWIGPATDPMSVSGNGTVEVRNGQVIQIPFFKTLSQLLGVEALGQPDFSSCKMEFTVADQVATISTLNMKSALFALSGTGTVGFDSSLKMDCHLDLSSDLVKQLPSTIEKALEKHDDGSRSIPFKLTGTIEKPNVELVLSQTMINQAVDALKGLFGPKKDKAKTDAAPPTATDSTTTPAATTSIPVGTP